MSKKALIILGFIALFLLNTVIYYVAMPFLVVWIFSMIGIEVGFWLVFWILFVLYILLGLVRK